MAWKMMVLRGTKVFARVNDAGDFVEEGGRVEIRYKPNDGRAYAASTRNLKSAGGAILPDDHCGEAVRPETKKASGKKAGGRKRGASKSNGKPPPTEPAAGEALAYADGACSGNPGPAGAGVILIHAEGCLELSEYLGRGTNNIGELVAILRAAEQSLELGLPLTLYTDSSYSIGVLSKGWKAKKNQELVAQTKEALAALPGFELHYVKGHAGIPLNERADELAVAAVQQRASSGWVEA
jgi:ribonuclease HI